jgi:hypothetical protein
MIGDAEITSPAAGDRVASRKSGEVVRRHSCRRTGEGAGVEMDACALTRRSRTRVGRDEGAGVEMNEGALTRHSRTRVDLSRRER